MRNIWVYDLEQTVNFHSCAAINIDSGERLFFVLSSFRNNFEEYVKWLKSPRLILIGYNNLDFDYQLLHILLTSNLKGDRLITELYNRTQVLVDNTLDKRSKNLIPEWKQLIPQLDCFRIAHFDNEAKRTSLKALQASMRMDRIQDIPFKHTDLITEETLSIVEEYNFHDVEATLLFFKTHLTKAVKLRKDISVSHKINVMNANDIKIGEEIFTKRLSADMGIPIWELKRLRTNRSDGIALKECIIPNLTFKSKEFNSILHFFKDQYLYETKRVFSDIPITKLGELWNYCAKSETSSNTKSKTLIKKTDGVEVLKKLNVVYKGFQYDFGSGGVHGCIKPGIYKSDNHRVTVDLDISSFYPNIAICNNFRPEHLGDSFSKIYSFIYDMRKQIPKTNPDNAAYKLALNGCFGKSNEPNSLFYDPAFMLKITINGQLLICSLAEQIVGAIDNCTVLQVNTDGITICIDRSDENSLDKICKDWEETTGLQLEKFTYKQMIIRDVNNYLAEYETGGLKHKGTFQIDKELHKNPSKRVVAIALENFFIRDIPVAQTIRQHINGITYGDYENYGIYDYCIVKKAVGGWYYQSLSAKDGELSIERLNDKMFRYFVSNRGKCYEKTNGTGKSLVEAHPMKGKTYYLTPFNKYFESQMYDLNYQYYIRECNKIVNIIKPNQISLL